MVPISVVIAALILAVTSGEVSATKKRSQAPGMEPAARPARQNRLLADYNPALTLASPQVPTRTYSTTRNGNLVKSFTEDGVHPPKPVCKFQHLQEPVEKGEVLRFGVSGVGGDSEHWNKFVTSVIGDTSASRLSDQQPSVDLGAENRRLRAGHSTTTDVQGTNMAEVPDSMAVDKMSRSPAPGNGADLRPAADEQRGLFYEQLQHSDEGLNQAALWALLAQQQPNTGLNTGAPASEAIDDYDDDSTYRFGFRVSDRNTGAEYGRAETREGKVTKGNYHVLLPDGRLQNVDYWADHTGYHVQVTYTGVAHHL